MAAHFLIFLTRFAFAENDGDACTLPGVTAYGIKNNARTRSAKTEVAIEAYGIRSSEADRLPQFGLTGGAAQYRYPTPVTPFTLRLRRT